MSAAGISVFYGALDMKTAKAETTANLNATGDRIMTGAMWISTRPLNVLNLPKLPDPPSFHAGASYERDHLLLKST
jgi:hypothetical protein